MAKELTGWELLNEYNDALPRWATRTTPGTFKKSSELTRKDDAPNRSYGGRLMSVSRLKATGPTRQHVAQRINDITM